MGGSGTAPAAIRPGNPQQIRGRRWDHLGVVSAGGGVATWSNWRSLSRRSWLWATPLVPTTGSRTGSWQRHLWQTRPWRSATSVLDSLSEPLGRERGACDPTREQRVKPVRQLRRGEYLASGDPIFVRSGNDKRHGGRDHRGAWNDHVAVHNYNQREWTPSSSLGSSVTLTVPAGATAGGPRTASVNSRPPETSQRWHSNAPARLDVTWTVLSAANAACAPPSPNLSINDVSLSEGNSGTTNFTFTASLSAPAPASGVCSTSRPPTTRPPPRTTTTSRRASRVRRSRRGTRRNLRCGGERRHHV